MRLDALRPNPHNPRTIQGAAFARLKTSIQRDPQFMALRPIVYDQDRMILGGNMRYRACQELGMVEIPDAWAVCAADLSEEQKRRFILVDNSPEGLAGEWDFEMLAAEWEIPELEDLGFNLADLAIDDPGTPLDAEPQLDRAEELRQAWQVETGQLWQVGRHRLLCSDSTRPEEVARVMGGEVAILVQADPPYGMGKENEGIQNDNLYAEKLDAFQMAWWRAVRPQLADNASVYIWGNAPDLWRLWYVGGLKDSERLTLRNEIVWDKREDNPTMLVSGVPLESRRMYQPTERCLFFMLGEQGFNINADNYWEGWEPIRAYLDGEMNKCGGSKNWKKALGNQMGGHYFTRSQWSFPTEENYRKLQAFAQGDDFKRDYDDLKRDYDDLKRDYDDLKRDFYATRAFFDNTHDAMTDVWSFSRVTGKERQEHATPKPVEMIGRCIKSSAPAAGNVLDPFLGSGTTLMACESLNRTCFALEISPAYVAVALQRWADATGGKPEKIG